MPLIWKSLTRTAAIASLLCFFAGAAQADDAKTSDWAQSIEIYAQAVNIGGDARVGNLPVNVDVDPEFIMDHLEMAGMLRFESIKNNDWGYIVDYGFMELGGERNGLFLNGPGLANADIDVRQGVMEVKGFNRATNGTATFDFTFGLRWWDVDGKATVDLVNGTRLAESKINEDWIDYVIGFRLEDDLSDNWRAYFNTDVGTGSDTDFTSLFHAGAMYHINDWSDLNLSYRSVWVDYRNRGTFEYVTSTQGFMIGWIARF